MQLLTVQYLYYICTQQTKFTKNNPLFMIYKNYIINVLLYYIISEGENK